MLIEIEINFLQNTLNNERETNPERDKDQNSNHSFIRKVLISVFIAASILLLVHFVGYAIEEILGDSMDRNVDTEHDGKTIV